MIYFPGAQHTEALRNPFMFIWNQICRCTGKGEFVKLSDREHKTTRLVYLRIHRPPDLPLEKSVCRSGSKLELDMEKQTGSKLGKEYVGAVYCHPAYIPYMQSTSSEILNWMKHKLESRLLGEISITSDMQIRPPLLQKQRRSKEPLDESERGE